MQSRSDITRRGFLGSSLAGAAFGGGLALMRTQPAGAEPTAPEAVLKGFIVSDAHFGWDHPDQQPSSVIRAHMHHILERFPDLDVFLDTGDCHHGNATDAARGEWTDIIAHGCGPLPFYYTAGNHDIHAWGHEAGPEERTCALASIPFRPYYSFDVKGVHFVAFPELMMMSYLTDESIEWLKLDLAVNADKTTIVLSHNSVAGTTKPHDDLGYRQLADSEAVFDLLNAYPQVVAWMHGHNHTFELVRKRGKFYVSNGRIGGFNPKYPGGWWGQDHHGGIYFEVTPGGLTVRGYSTTKRRFFDELEHYGHLTQTLERPTSVDPQTPFVFSYGYGGARDGQKHLVRHHHAGASARELFLAGGASPVLNENADLSTYVKRTIPHWQTKLMPGFTITPRREDENKTDQSWQWLDPGVRLLPLESPDIARVLASPKWGQARSAYYRTAPGKSYRVRTEVACEKPGVTMQWGAGYFDSDENELRIDQKEPLELQPGRRVYETVFTVPPELAAHTLYDDGAALLQFVIQAKFQPMLCPVDVFRFEISLDGAEGPARDAALRVGGERFSKEGELAGAPGGARDLPPAGDNVEEVEVTAGGGGRLTWLVRETGPAWQVRGATVSAADGKLRIGPLRNGFSPKQEVVIAPTARAATSPFVCRLLHVDRAVITPFNPDEGSLVAHVERMVSDGARIEVASAERPDKVRGASDWRYANGVVSVAIDAPGKVELYYG